MTNLERRLAQTADINVHSSFLSSLPRCYYMHEFSVNHMRTTNALNTLSAQSDQPHCCLLLKYLYLLSIGLSILVLRPYLCILGIFNRNIWNANSNGSGQTCDVQSRQDICRSLKLKIYPKNLMTSQKIIS